VCLTTWWALARHSAMDFGYPFWPIWSMNHIRRLERKNHSTDRVQRVPVLQPDPVPMHRVIRRPSWLMLFCRRVSRQGSLTGVAGDVERAANADQGLRR